MKRLFIPLIGFVSIPFIIMFIARLMVINAVTDVTIATVEDLGTKNLCPDEFKTEQYSVCFDKEGNVIMNGKLNEPLTLKIDILGNACHITSGDYDFEYTGCKLEKFKQITAYDLILINKKGEIRIKGLELINKIAKGSEVFAITPNGFKWFKRSSYFMRI